MMEGDEVVASPAAAVGLSVATAIALAVAGVCALSGATPHAVVVLVAASFLPYAGLLLVAPPSRRTALFVALGLAAGAGAVLVLAPSLLSDDLYRYLWDARVLASGIDPYLYAPDDPALFALRDGLHGQINHPEVPTIYPPGAQFVFAVAEAVAHAPWAVKAVALALHLTTIPLVMRLAGEERAARAALLYGLNPLALVESALGGHVDVAVGLCLAVFVLALTRDRVRWAVAAIVAAAAIKVVGIVLAPLVALRQRRAAWLAVALAAAVVAPIFGAGRGSDEVAGIGQYARRWRGNEGLFTLVEAGVGVVVDEVAARTWSAPGRIRLPGLAPVVAAFEGTPLDPWATQLAEKKEAPDRTEFERSYVTGMLARAVVFSLVVLLSLFLVSRRIPPLAAARALVLAVLLLSPQLHPWYLLWLLPLEVAAGGGPGLVFSAAILSAYAPQPGASLLAHGFIVAMLGYELHALRAKGKISRALAVHAH